MNIQVCSTKDAGREVVYVEAKNRLLHTPTEIQFQNAELPHSIYIYGGLRYLKGDMT